MDDKTKGEVAIIDYGLMVSIPEKERKQMVSAIIHLSNKNFDALTTDFQKLDFLPEKIDRPKVVQVTENILGPYISRGSQDSVTGKVEDYSFENVTRELLKAQFEIPLNIPPYICELAKSIAMLEGVALQVDPNYRIVMEAYPFVTRRLFKDSGDGAQKLLRETLYDDQGRIRP